MTGGSIAMPSISGLTPERNHKLISDVPLVSRPITNNGAVSAGIPTRLARLLVTFPGAIAIVSTPIATQPG
jgi:hypothetical protein